jgi:hypothetical protein
MAKNKYQKRKENLDVRLASEGLTREAGRIVPVRKDKVEQSVSATSEVAQEKKVVLPPAAKKQVKTQTQPKRKSSSNSNTTSTTSYGWFQKVIVFSVLLGLVGVGFVSLAGSSPTPEVISTPTPSESIISEQTITVPPAEPTAESTPAN